MPEPTPHRCPVCWSSFTATKPTARYCCGACRAEDSRRRRNTPDTTPIPGRQTMTPTPSRDDNETTTTPPAWCPLCHHAFTPIRRQLYCSEICRKTAWRRRTANHPPAMPVPPPGPKRDTTVYACPECDTRYLAEQRCPDCNVFCRRVGVGGPCPHCEEPVALTDLITDTPTEMITMPIP